MKREKIITRERSKAFPVVGIGASAGGLEAFTELLKALPDNTGMAFVLVQHLDPAHESALADIIGRITKMPTVEVKNHLSVEPDHVYVIPPNKDMTLLAGKFYLVPRTETRGRHLPIDSFFSSLARERGGQAVGVILSGSASDGAIGQKAIKSREGITFSQNIESSQYDSMPRSAIASGCIDYVMRPKDIAKKLVELSRCLPLKEIETKSVEQLWGNIKDNFTKVCVLLKYHTGVDFSYYKKTTIDRRIKRRMGITKKATLKEYLQLLRHNHGEVGILFQDLLINVTSFFRDPKLFRILEKKVFPAIIKNKQADQPIRIWVTACSTGEEAYSLAICLLESLGRAAATRQG